MKSVVVGIIGGTGYTGMELLRLFDQHPAVRVRCITSRAENGKSVSELFPALRGKFDLVFSDPAEAGLADCDVVFSAAPNGVAMTHAPDLLNSGTKLIDLSADFRLQDIATWESWYGMTHACPDLVRQAVYGLPEVHRDAIGSAQLVANPGCYPTAVQIGYFPLLSEGLIETDSLIADAKSGVSGAGRKASIGTLYSELSESFKAYAASGHRHLPEIRQGLNAASEEPVDLLFTPHLVPMIRGIHATLYCRLKDEHAGLSLAQIQRVFEERYSREPFVDVMPEGSHPDTRSVRGSNMCRVALHRPGDGRNLVILAVEDNLVKGAAGQAIQNMNIMFGLEETMGLDGIALVP